MKCCSTVELYTLLKMIACKAVDVHNHSTVMPILSSAIIPLDPTLMHKPQTPTSHASHSPALVPNSIMLISQNLTIRQLCFLLAHGPNVLERCLGVAWENASIYCTLEVLLGDLLPPAQKG
jgi:hypothetical protein